MASYIRTTFDLTELDKAAEETAVDALRDTYFWPAVVSLANQGMSPKDARHELLKRLPTWAGHAQYFELAVRALQRKE